MHKGEWRTSNNLSISNQPNNQQKQQSQIQIHIHENVAGIETKMVIIYNQ